ncbi:MAG: type II and III secretion system protein [Planctomycetes bacterium]|nr:type II and III secretion system protein [Planctomycetota bacterium]
MVAKSTEKRRWLQFSLTQLLTLTSGIAIGLSPLVWRYIYPPPEPNIIVEFAAYELLASEARKLSIPAHTATVSRSVPLTRLAPDFQNRLDTLVRMKGARLLASQHVVTHRSGSPVSYSCGGMIPTGTWDKHGGGKLEYQKYGIELNAMTNRLDDGSIHVAVGFEHTELSPTQLQKVTGFGFTPLKTIKLATEADVRNGETVLASSEIRNQEDGRDGKELVCLVRASDVKR